MFSLPIRKRRLRKTPLLRDMVAETRIQRESLVYPIFINERLNQPQAVESMPGIFQHSLESATRHVEDVLKKGVQSFLLFGIPAEKDEAATGAWQDSGIIQTGIRTLKKQFGDDVFLIADTCLCEYMSHGHCGIIENGPEGNIGEIQNDRSVEILAQTAVSQAEAGADMIAPSDMMDGRIQVIRDELDAAGCHNTPIMAYSAKYASSLYAPFRDAAESTPASGDRKSYQMDPRNSKEALEEVHLDVSEGADIILVKPALSYLDIIAKVADAIDLPIAAYSVSGEYSMIKAAAEKGWPDEKAVVLETTTSIVRAGASIVITYFAPQIAEWID